MICYKKTTILLCELLLYFVVVLNCERDLSTSEDVKPEPLKEKECLKDGLMTLSTIKAVRQTNGKIDKVLDSLFVSEIDNRIDVINGVPFQVPEMWNLEINFQGDFEGMPNKIFYLFRYKRESKKNGIIEEWMSGEVKSNATAVILTSLGKTAFDIRGIVFALDDDDSHTGKGEVIVEHDAVPIDTLFIDSAANTVVYGSQAVNLPMTLDSSDVVVDVLIFDRCSFINENVKVAWFVEDDSTKFVDFFNISTNNGQFLPEKFGSRVLLWAFSAHFKQLENNDE